MKKNILGILLLLGTAGNASPTDSLFEVYVEAQPGAAKALAALALGKALASHHHVDSSLYYFRYVLDQPATSVGQENQAKAAFNLGYYQRSLARYGDAILNYEQAANFYSQIDAYGMAARAYWDIGECYTMLGDMAKAQAYYDRTEGLFLQHGWPRNSYIFYQNRGYACWKTEAYTQALYFLEKALAQNPGDTVRLSQVKNLMGLIEIKQGNYESAYYQLITAKQLAQHLHDIETFISPVHNLGLLYLKQNELDTAYRLFQEAYNTAKPFHYSVIAGNALLNLSRIHYRKGQMLAAAETVTETIAMAQHIPDKTLLLAALEHGLAVCWATDNEKQHQAWFALLMANMVSASQVASAQRQLEVFSEIQQRVLEQKLAELEAEYSPDSKIWTPSFALGLALVGLVLSLWLAYRLYRRVHEPTVAARALHAEVAKLRRRLRQHEEIAAKEAARKETLRQELEALHER